MDHPDLEVGGQGEAAPDRSPGEPFRILFVCTGNTCRSPLAEVLARDELERRKWAHVQVRSAGVAAGIGGGASKGSLRAAYRHGLDLSGHVSSPLSQEAVEWADLIFTMSRGQLAALQTLPSAAGKSTLISSFAEGGDDDEGEDVPDPFGHTQDAYEQTFQDLRNLVRRVLDRLEPVITP